MLSRILLAVWFVLAGLSAAHADPVSIVLGIGSWIAGAGAFVQTLLGVAFKAGLSLIEKALTPKSKAQEPGVQADIQVGGDNPLSFIMGSFADAGQLEYINTWGNAGETPNAYLTQVISLADIPLHALTGLWVNDQKVTLPTMTGTAPYPQGWPVAEFEKPSGNNHLWIRFYDGTQTAADQFLIDTFGADPDRPWTSDMIGRGVPYVVVTAQTDTALFSGVPAYLSETDGCRWYDIRKDTTAGGSGTHRWSDQSTWEPSDNPIVHAYNVIRGITYNGTWVYGGQTTQAYQLPAANWMAAINACDIAIPLAAGGTEKQYRSGCRISTDQEPADVLESILKGCSGRLVEAGGIYKVTVGAPGAAVYSFTDENIVVTEGQSFDPFPGLEQTYNGAQASYPEPAEKWASKDAPAYLRTDLEVLDDNRRLVTGLKFPTVPYAVQVQRLLKEAIQDSRRFRQHQFYLPPEAWLLEPGDVVSWTSSRNSYSNKKFLITSIEGGSNFLQLVSLKEVDPSDFTWNPATDQKPYSVGPIGPIRPAAQQMTGWQAFPAAFRDAASNARRPSIEIRFPGNLDDVEFVRVQVRLASSGAIVFDGVIPYGNPATNANPVSIVLNGTFLPATGYEARGIFEPYSGRDTEWGGWLPVTTDDIRLGDSDIYPINLGQLAQDFKNLQAFTGNAVRDVLEQLQGVSTNSAGNFLVGFSDKQSLRRELVSVTDDATAKFTEQIITATGPGSALALKIDAVEAMVDDPVTGLAANATAVQQLSTTVTAQAGTIAANASAIIALQTTVGDVSAGSTFRMGTDYTPAAGWSSRIGIEARVTSGSTFRSSGLYIEATASASRIVLDTDQFVIMAGGVVTALFDAGTAFIANARIRNLTAGNITASKLDAGQVLQNGTLITSLIAGNAITDWDNQAFFLSTGANGPSFVTRVTITVNNTGAIPPLVFARMNSVYTAGGGSSSATVNMRLVRTVGGVDTVLRSVTYNSNSGVYEPVFLDAAAPAGTFTYRIDTNHTPAGGAGITIDCSVTANWWKK
ncbi:phage tail protein [Mesorhizobium sp. B1-1-4]|uniref:phage tail protein n=1 Tax=Mesorhizobium sp. B1-1-4 TaxID=2589980 RepID=UPI00112CCF4D|nr:phage tail protein [Mesorhizobium sp. B1-1-4]TPN44467.1 phage tail protein [Mesorhizobium sp. B1-1-4]